MYGLFVDYKKLTDFELYSFSKELKKGSFIFIYRGVGFNRKLHLLNIMFKKGLMESRSDLYNRVFYSRGILVKFGKGDPVRVPFHKGYKPDFILRVSLGKLFKSLDQRVIISLLVKLKIDSVSLFLIKKICFNRCGVGLIDNVLGKFIFKIILSELEIESRIFICSCNISRRNCDFRVYYEGLKSRLLSIDYKNNF